MRRLSLFLLLIPFWLLAACSDDDDDPAPSPTVQAAATQPVAAPTLAAPSTGVEAAIEGTISVDFTGAPQELEKLEAGFEVPAGSTAWEAIQGAVGEENLSYDDFGGTLGIFITGFNGVVVEGNHFWEFKVNGETAEVGVSSYEVQQGDVLEFVYSSF